MQSIFLSVCANNMIGSENNGARKIVADAILKEFCDGNKDIDAVRAAATIAAKSATRANESPLRQFK